MGKIIDGIKAWTKGKWHSTSPFWRGFLLTFIGIPLSIGSIVLCVKLFSAFPTVGKVMGIVTVLVLVSFVVGLMANDEYGAEWRAERRK